VARVLAVDAVRPAPAALSAAAEVLRGDGVVAFPTETFYGLAASVHSAIAIARVFAVKGRPETKPILVLVDSIEMAASLAVAVSPTARALMDAHWPGAVTLVVPARPSVPSTLTAGTRTIGVRWPAHAVAVGLVRALGHPVTAPSANPTDASPPRTADEVLAYFGDALDLVLDGGATPGGAPSTVVDVTVDPPRILRRGAVAVDVAMAGRGVA
jgi:L-threonylcarbamoyladenylate synthase